MNPPWKGKIIKVPIGELRKITDNAYALTTQYAAGVKKELYGEDAPVEIQPPSPEPTPKESRPLTPQVSSLPPTRPSPTKSQPEPSQSTPRAIPTKDATVWSQISKQISGKQNDKAPTSQITPPSRERPTMPTRKDQPKVVPTAHTPPTPPASPIEPPKKLKCPKCKKNVQSDFKFCPHCRTPLFCISCGYPILDRKWKACPSCGFVFPK